jgi:ketosteroid isomerase-like protein
MSQENVEIVRRVLEAFNDRAVEGAIGLSHPDCEWHPFRAQLEGMVYRGHEGLRQFVRDMEEDWEAFRIELSGGRIAKLVSHSEPAVALEAVRLAE